MTYRRFLPLSLLLSLLVLSGCLVNSRAPLVAPEDALADPRLVGRWQLVADDEVITLIIEHSAPGGTDVKIVSQRKDSEETEEDLGRLLPTKLAGFDIVSIPSDPSNDLDLAYSFAQYSVDEHRLTIWFTYVALVASLVEEGLAGTIHVGFLGRSVRLEAETDVLRASFQEAGVTKVFAHEVGVFERLP